jgi:hypothetical protein
VVIIQKKLRAAVGLHLLRISILKLMKRYTSNILLLSISSTDEYSAEVMDLFMVQLILYTYSISGWHASSNLRRLEEPLAHGERNMLR